LEERLASARPTGSRAACGPRAAAVTRRATRAARL
jgi:hypothetical protein